MKAGEDDSDIVEHLAEDKGLRLVPSEQRESLLPDPELKELIEEMMSK